MIRQIYILAFLATLLGAFSSDLNAQEYNDKQVQLIDGKTYYLHQVEKGNTLYSISKMYSIKIKDLLRENPQLEEGLKVGQVIRIPVKKVDTKVSGNNTPTVSGADLIHEVQQGETMYKLTRKYQVTEEELQAANPELKDGLKLGMKLKIPTPTQGRIDTTHIAPAVEDSLVHHLVMHGETLYSLAKEYNVNIDSITLVNNGLPDGLKVGSTIRIPLLKNPKKGKPLISEVEKDTSLILPESELKKRYQITMMLPYYLDTNDSLELKRKPYEDEVIFSRSEIALQFYGGFKLALDSMVRAGGQFDVMQFDTKFDPRSRSTEPVKEALMNAQLLNTDLFIGPLHRSNFMEVSKYAQEIKTPLVSPVPQKDEVLKDNPYAIKVHSSSAVQARFLREYAIQQKGKKNLILILNNYYKDRVIWEHFLGIPNGDTNQEVYSRVLDNFKIVRFDQLDTSQLMPLMDDSLENLIVVPVQSKSFVGRFLGDLNRYSSKYPISVLGMDRWSSFGYIDYRYLNNLKVHYPSNQYVDYSRIEVEKFVLDYRNTYDCEPNDWGFLGYDMGIYFLQQLMEQGTTFQANWPGEEYKGLSRNFRFEKYSTTGGYQNTGIRLIKMENYLLNEVE
ncbi:LysM peptidoglycan-binding domain-containing protein [bacterium SCSIO 12741]|nr:LysM peptidoglycan-binding domain-containing protein [bacterium SCSIO 12741]